MTSSVTSLRPSRIATSPTGAVLGGGVIVAAALAWVLTVNRMGGMDASPAAGLGGLGWFTVSWAVMMAAMMLPSLAPAALVVPRRAPGKVAGFIGGYLAVWTAAGLVAFALITAVRGLDVPFLAWDRGGRYLAAGVLCAAAAYQFTGAKARCLERCRSVELGSPSSLSGGVRHGVTCIGCCATMMAALFALGVMSVTWMVIVAVLITAERVLPWPRPAVYGVAVVLLVVGVWLAFAPGDLPGFTVPGAMNGMAGMGGR